MTTKTCMNCAHRFSFIGYAEAECVRTGTYCDNEMKYGGRCAGPKTGVPEMNLWEQRKPTWFARIFKITRL